MSGRHCFLVRPLPRSYIGSQAPSARTGASIVMMTKRNPKRMSDRLELVLTLGTGLAALWVLAALVFSMV